MVEDEPDNVDFGDGVKDFDDILVLIGEFGKFQKLVFLLLSVASILPAMDYAAVVFIEETPDFRCRLPGDLNDSYFPRVSWYQNTSDDVTSNSTAQCTHLDVVIYHQGNVSQDGTHPSKCTEWVFDTSVVKHSYPMQFKLVCDNSWMLTFSYIMYVSGTLIGGLAFGLLSDWAGRRFSLLLALGLSGIFGLGWVFSPTYPCSIAIRFMYGMFTSEIFTLSTTLALELVGPHKRMIAGTVVGIVSTAGGVVVTGIAYFLRDWRHLQLSISAPYLVFAATLFWLLPESPRWLLTKGRHEEAEKILRRAAKMNGKEFPKGLLTKVEINELPSTSIRALLHAPKLMFRMLLLYINWMILDMTHYGISLHTGNMAGNIYLNFLLYSLVDFPGYALCFTIDRFGRKKIYTLCLVTGGLACLSTLFVHLYGEEDATYSYYVKMALSTVGKLGIAAAYGISYIWGVELFPTVVRNFSLGLGSVASCAGAILTPIVVREVKADSIGEDTLPLVIFGVAAIFGAICTIPLPETTNRDLPETIEDAENFQRRTKRKLDEKEYHISPTIEMTEMPRKNASATSRLSI